MVVLRVREVDSLHTLHQHSVCQYQLFISLREYNCIIHFVIYFKACGQSLWRPMEFSTLHTCSGTFASAVQKTLVRTWSWWCETTSCGLCIYKVSLTVQRCVCISQSLESHISDASLVCDHSCLFIRIKAAKKETSLWMAWDDEVNCPSIEQDRPCDTSEPEGKVASLQSVAQQNAWTTAWDHMFH